MPTACPVLSRGRDIKEAEHSSLLQLPSNRGGTSETIEEGHNHTGARLQATNYKYHWNAKRAGMS